jgi:hypothetical protein
MTRTATYAATRAVAVTPSDTTTFGDQTRALWVGGSGAVKVRMSDGSDCVFSDLSATLLPIQCDMVYSTGTTATNIVAMF